MAKTIAKCYGYDEKRVKEAHRLGSKMARVEANTFRTFTEALMRADGSGCVTVIRDGMVLHHFVYGPE